MIIIITGASHSGKTILAQKLLEKLKIPYLCQDHIKMGLIRAKMIDVSVYEDEILVKILWPITLEIIKTAMENNQNLIIEGCYIPYTFLDDLKDEYGKIKYINLILSQEYIEKNYGTIISNESVIEKRKNSYDINKEFLIKENLKNLSSCIKNNLDYILINNDYDKEISKIIESMEEGV